MTSSPSPHALIIGRSVAERSAIAQAMHRLGLSIHELERASDLTPHILRHTHIVIALDQHAYLTRVLREAQSYGAAPLLLPIGQESSASSPDSPDPKPSVAPVNKDTIPPAPRSDDLHAHHQALLARAQHLARQDAATDPARLRAQYHALVQQILLLPLDPDAALLDNLSTPEGVKRTVELRDIYEVMPEHDPRNQDPGPLPELDTPASTRWVAVFAGVLALAASAYLLLAPPTERERQEERALQENAAETSGYERAAHVTYQARILAAHNPLHIQTEPVRCRRLLDEGRLELARKVCGRAYTHDGSAAAPLAQVLMRSHAAQEAIELLQERVAARPEDLAAWELLASAARQIGDSQIEQQAILHLINLHERHDPVTPLRERLERLENEPPEQPPVRVDP